jgi:ABC-2 type transport system ATP-binding protein
MPRLADSRILEAAYKDGSAVLKASSDIRDDISRDLARGGFVIRELSVEEETLEDVFLETVYGGV